MPREKFPYEADKRVIRAFLGGDTSTPVSQFPDETSLRIVSGGGLMSGDTRFLWYDSADAITTVVDGPIAKHIANYVLEAVGSEQRITVEVNDDQPDNARHRVRYYFDGVPADEAPFALVGPMTLMAWRAENGFSLSARSKLRRK